VTAAEEAGPPRTTIGNMTDLEMRILAATIIPGLKLDDVEAVAIVIGTRDGEIGIVGSARVSSDVPMLLLLAGAIDRSAMQLAYESGLIQ